MDGIDKLFSNKNNALHRLVDDAQHHARIYSQQVFNRPKNKTKNGTDVDLTDDTATDKPDVTRLTTQSSLVNKTFTNQQNLSVYYKAIEYPDELENNQTSRFPSPNEVYNNENEYRQITTTTTLPSNEIIENQGEPTNKLEEVSDRLQFSAPEFQSLIVSEEETMQNQLEIDKKINESLNRANYLTTTTTLPSTTTVETDDEETNEIIDKQDKEIAGNQTAKDSSEDENDEDDGDEFLYFKDTKKIFSPDKPLSNLSIPRQVPDDLAELSDDEQKEFKERWKTWTPMKTIKHGLFPNYRLNFSSSGLHIPLNVYPQLENIKHAIKWSDRLDETFKENRKFDPYLSFQFFCSNDGFLRMHPLVSVVELLLCLCV